MQQQANTEQIRDLQARCTADPNDGDEGGEVGAGFAHAGVPGYVAPVVGACTTIAVGRAGVDGRAFRESALDVQELGVGVTDEG